MHDIEGVTLTSPSCRKIIRVMSTVGDIEQRDTASINEAAHVDYILTADFDVDAGPIISHQYPEPLGGDVRYKPPCFEREEGADVVKCWQS